MAMIGYVTLGTNDRERGAKFYDALAAELGAGRMMETEQFIAWGAPGAGAGIGLTTPFDGKDRAHVDRIHRVALEAGGTDEGAPGERGTGFYAGYFRDPDGNKFNAFVMG
jgi:catechol 2,3-dioxygenase-like lactoylglutathione lyase family enzyme